MSHLPTRSLVAALAVLSPQAPLEAHAAAASELDELVDAFAARTGARLVFTREEVPADAGFDVMPLLDAARRLDAARIALAEATKYPRGYLGALGLRTIGLYQGLASKTGDGFRPWAPRLGGYRYFGQWDGDHTIVAAYYNDPQLPLTLHHEVFHGVDATVDGVQLASNAAEDDARFAAAVAGEQRYPAAAIAAEDLAALAGRSGGVVLDDAVSDYAAKGPGEDQAETARHLMSHLPDALIQIATQPELAGSQRLLHVLDQYARSTVDGPDVAWLVDVALGRDPAASRQRDNQYLHKVDDEIRDPSLRRAIRRVQPAAVRLGRASGVNLASTGTILTAAHVVDAHGQRLRVAFPDGTTVNAVVTAIDHTLDLALLTVEAGGGDLAWAPLAAAAPVRGATVVVIGQPGTRTPAGEATGYLPWHVSRGQIRGVRGDALADQSLGGTMHDAWTYWGHSGSPLFDDHGRIVGLHNSWDSSTAMRHAVRHEAIVHFLDAHGVSYTRR
ncbi:serine protease [Nannocystis sp.]|uniref:S1 family peptidase n=1 Tax=Nannocystis sp. TaxID=1962667 RepID=UPI0024273719|nr:serine protease [Nannocystis sp.]MBK7827421.1 trypsin-like peptidase domain-containing protein [Nannocystis sp.]MBK9756305.1 trypsin-like peptidase domain-containing protein [Nannocystis sp.]